MKQYFYFIGKYLLYSFCFVCFIYFINSIVFDRVHSNAFKNLNTIMLGDSHFNGLNDKIIPNSRNMAMDAEIYFSMYNKLKEINKHTNLKNLILIYSYRNLSKKNNDELILDSKMHSYNVSRINYSLASIATQLKQSKRWGQLIKVFCKFNFTFNYVYFINLINNKKNTPFYSDKRGVDIKFLKIKHLNRKHKFNSSARNYNTKINNWINFVYGENDDFARKNIDYLFNIVEFCEENDITLYLVSTPLELNYYEKIPVFYKEEHKRIREMILKKYHKTYFLNYVDYFKKDSYFLDQEHVTMYANALISKEISKELIKN